MVGVKECLADAVGALAIVPGYCDQRVASLQHPRVHLLLKVHWSATLCDVCCCSILSSKRSSCICNPSELSTL